MLESGLSRDDTKLAFYSTADDLALRVYEVTRTLRVSERYGLQSQLRRAAVSTVTNVVEGCARRSGRAYMQFLEIALGSASEVRYLLQLCERLKLLRHEDVAPIVTRYTSVIKAVQATMSTIAAADSR